MDFLKQYKWYDVGHNVKIQDITPISTSSIQQPPKFPIPSQVAKANQHCDPAGELSYSNFKNTIWNFLRPKTQSHKPQNSKTTKSYLPKCVCGYNNYSSAQK